MTLSRLHYSRLLLFINARSIIFVKSIKLMEYSCFRIRPTCMVQKYENLAYARGKNMELGLRTRFKI